MKSQVDRDERTVTIEKSSHSIAYLFMSFALLLDVAYRAFILGESSFDLLVIIVLSGVIATLYQARNRTLTPSWIKTTVMALAIAIVIAIMIVTLK